MCDEIIEYAGGVKFNMSHYRRVTSHREAEKIANPLIGKRLRSKFDSEYVHVIIDVKEKKMNGDLIHILVCKKLPHIDPNEPIQEMISSGINVKDECNIDLIKSFNVLFEIV